MRKCVVADLPQVLGFYQLVAREDDEMARYARWVYGKHPTKEMIEAYVCQDAMYVLEDGRTILAAAALTPYQTKDYHGVDWQVALKDDEVAVVHILAVNPCFRGRSYARAIMRDMIALTEKNGLKAVRLDALACNIPAHRLYESLGFRKCGTRHWYAENTGWTDFDLFEYECK